MAKAKVTDLRKMYPELAPDKDYPPLRFKSLKGKVSAASGRRASTARAPTGW